MSEACESCGKLPKRLTVDLQEGEKLPPETRGLDVLAGTDVWRCPACGAFFLYDYEYEYGAIGDGWETASVERVDRDEAIGVLLSSPPSKEVAAVLATLGVPDAEAAMRKKLEADLEGDATCYDAARTLVGLAMSAADWPAVERLLRHPKEKVRSDTLYLLQVHRGALLFKAIRALNDPAAAPVSLVTPDPAPLEPAIIACLADPGNQVRVNAGWALAVLAEDGRDISNALPALAKRVAEDPHHPARKVAVRALVAAAKHGADLGPAVALLRRLPEDDPLRTEVLGTQPKLKRIVVCRCPKCGSTAAGCDESRSAYEFSYMHCRSCGHGTLADSWQRDSDWLAEVDVPVNAKSEPDFVAPLKPGEGLFDLGCVVCQGEDTEKAWASMRQKRDKPLLQEKRFGVQVSACTCKQHWAIVFIEAGGEERWRAFPLIDAWKKELQAADAKALPAALTRMAKGSRYLERVRSGETTRLAWHTGGFAVELP